MKSFHRLRSLIPCPRDGDRHEIDASPIVRVDRVDRAILLTYAFVGVSLRRYRWSEEEPEGMKDLSATGLDLCTVGFDLRAEVPVPCNFGGDAGGRPPT